MAGQPTYEHGLFLSTLPAQAGERRLALWVVLVSAAVFVAAAPFAKRSLPAVDAFLPIYQSAVVLNELITAVLLYGQFAILRSRALLLLAGAYLFSSLMAVSHALSFPGLFAKSGLFGGPQTTAWLYFLWHAGFPLLVMTYALLADEQQATTRLRGSAARGILANIGAILVLVCALTLLTAAGDALPVIMHGNRDAPAKVIVASATWILSLAALPILWRRRPHSVLDLWLMVVMCVWIFDSALAAVLNHARYDLGWYAGRVYGLLAASFVLLVLLLENGKLYALLASTHKQHQERLRILHEIDQSVVTNKTPESVAGSVIQPIRALLGVPRAIVNIFDLAAGEVEWLAAAGRSQTRVGPGVRYSIKLMGDVGALRRGEPQFIDTRKLPPGPEVDALLASGVNAYMAVPMIAGGELIGALSFGGAEGPFADEQLSIAGEVATQLAIAITQARLLERVQHHTDELEARVRARTAELEAVNRELEAFSYSVSHDLRAPLRAVTGFTMAVFEDHGAELSEEVRRKLGIVNEEALRMGQLIDELLAFSRLGRKALHAVALDMTAMARATFDSVLTQYDASRVELRLAALPPANGDRVLLGQVWVNLLANALKYSSKKAAALIEVDGATDARENTYLVRDNGVGFDPRYQSKLFRVFQRLHDASEFPGTGVGLALVERLVTRHGGRVWAEGRLNEGATFYFSLPKERVDGAV